MLVRHYDSSSFDGIVQNRHINDRISSYYKNHVQANVEGRRGVKYLYVVRHVSKRGRGDKRANMIQSFPDATSQITSPHQNQLLDIKL
jgi:hypothetical protein